MVQLIVGEKGKGKTKELLNYVEEIVKKATGSLVYIDKSQKHMFELSNKVRLIDASEYSVASCQEFIGFLCGIIASDHDIETIFLDNFRVLADLPDEGIEPAVVRLAEVSEQYGVNIVAVLSVDPATLSAKVNEYVYKAL